MKAYSNPKRILAAFDAAVSPADFHAALVLEHLFLCHSDGSVCQDGCNVRVDPVQLSSLEAAVIASAARCLCEEA